MEKLEIEQKASFNEEHLTTRENWSKTGKTAEKKQKAQK